MMSSADSSFANTLHTFGVIEAISRFGGISPYIARKVFSVDDYVGKVTSLFMPYLPKSISEKEFNELQVELKRILSEFKKN